MGIRNILLIVYTLSIPKMTFLPLLFLNTVYFYPDCKISAREIIQSNIIHTRNHTEKGT